LMALLGILLALISVIVIRVKKAATIKALDKI
jgi:hypothetical protein